MGHITEYHEYDVNLPQEEIVEALRESVEQSGGNSFSPIVWHKTRPFPNEMSAQAFLEKQTASCAVQYRSVQQNAVSKKYESLLARQEKLLERYKELNEKPYAATVTSEFIGCRKCGSKLSREYLLKRKVSVNNCPVCMQDLRPAKTQDAIQKVRANIDEVCAKIRHEQIKSARNSTDIRWLIKIQLHV